MSEDRTTINLSAEEYENYENYFDDKIWRNDNGLWTMMTV